VKTTFVPKPNQIPALPTFEDLEVGQGYRYPLPHPSGRNVFIKLSTSAVRPNCVGVDEWQLATESLDKAVIPVDLELREI
jgi:hypothetical protein